MTQGPDRTNRPPQVPAPDTGQDRAAPTVSVVMSTFNGARFLDAALRSVLSQTHRALEVIVVDDASTDDTPTLLRRIAATDPRVTAIFQTQNKGPAAARNVALDAARGTWLAIVDADDLIHPERVARLLAAADATGADMIADDIVPFGDPASAGQTLLAQRNVRGAPRITLTDLLRSDTTGRAGAGLTSLGYLKPMLRRETLGATRYDETLRIGEDFDLYMRLLLKGAVLRVVPDPTYLYRRHPGSLSHRLSDRALVRLIAAHDRAVRDVQPSDDDLAETDARAALAARRAHLCEALRYEQLVSAIKARKPWQVGKALVRDPTLLSRLAASLGERLGRRAGNGGPAKRLAGASPPPTLVLAPPDQLDTVHAPDGATRLPVLPLPPPAAPDTTAPHALATRLAAIATHGPVDVIAEGRDGLQALGFLPGWRSAHLTLAADTAKGASLPSGITLAIAPRPG